MPKRICIWRVGRGKAAAPLHHAAKLGEKTGERALTGFPQESSAVLMQSQSAPAAGSLADPLQTPSWAPSALDLNILQLPPGKKNARRLGQDRCSYPKKKRGGGGGGGGRVDAGAPERPTGRKITPAPRGGAPVRISVLFEIRSVRHSIRARASRCDDRAWPRSRRVLRHDVAWLQDHVGGVEALAQTVDDEQLEEAAPGTSPAAAES